MYLHGVGYEFTKYTGESVIFPFEVRKQALALSGIDVDSDDSLLNHNFTIDVLPWLSVVGSFCVIKQSEMILRVKVSESWLGSEVTISTPETQLCSTVLSDEYLFGEYRYNHTRFIDIGIKLPKLEVGYHACIVTLRDAVYYTELWVEPTTAHYLEENEKLVGLSIQLYSLNEKENFGIGDFGDLKNLIRQSATVVDYILLNPLHELFEEDPERASPYSPNDRCFLNPLYIDLFDCIELLPLQDKLAWRKKVSDALNTLDKSGQFIDYSSVSRAKYALLDSVYDEYQRLPSEYIKSSIYEYSEMFSLSNSEYQYRVLPRQAFFQWLANKQLKNCQNLAIQLGMKVGLISDLAVGCAQDGREYLEHKQLFSKGANVGAPPDPWAEEGQDWGLPALDPKLLAENNYAYYRRLIRSNMMDVGGLRIDHVMAIRRLWWCFSLENGERTGCYMYYPFEHLLAILKIESHLNSTILIGEDLGVVPPEVRQALHESQISSNILFYFEKDHEGQFVDPHWYKHNSLLMIANHDVPPFYGWWSYADVDIRYQYGLVDELKKQQLYDARTLERQKLCDWLSRHGQISVSTDDVTDKVYSALLRALSQSNSKYLTIQLDDLDENTTPVNIPGTNTEFPNWRRRLNNCVEDIFKSKNQLLVAVNNLRKSDV